MSSEVNNTNHNTVEKTPVSPGSKTLIEAKGGTPEMGADSSNSPQKELASRQPSTQGTQKSEIAVEQTTPQPEKKSSEIVSEMLEVVQTKRREINENRKKLIQEIKDLINEEELIKKKIDTVKEQQQSKLENQISQLQTRQKELDSQINIREKFLDTPPSASIIMELTPFIIKAVSNGEFTKENIDLFTQAIEKLFSNALLRSLSLRLQLQNMRDNPEALREFVSTINEITSMTDIPQKELTQKLHSFIYNTLVPPYQRDGEGSCFATSILMLLWRQKPIEYMRMIRDIVFDNKVNLEHLNNDNKTSIGVPNFGIHDNEYDQVYQKFISAIAKLGLSLEKGAQFKKILRETLPNMGLSTIPVTSILDWNHYWQLNIGLILSLFENNEHSWPSNIPSRDKIKQTLEDINNMKFTGGKMERIMDRITGPGARRSLRNDMEPLSSTKKNMFKIEDFQQVLDILKYGSCKDKSRKLKPGQFMCTGYAMRFEYFEGEEKKNRIAGHGFNFITGDYDLKKMKNGEKVLIGHMNYSDTSPDSLMFMKKINDSEIQLVNAEDQPITNGNITRIYFYPDFMTEYERNPDYTTLQSA